MVQYGRCRNKFYFPFLTMIFILFFSCTDEEKKQVQKTSDHVLTASQKKIQTPLFNQDSAYAFVKEQVDFGPRVPGTKAHENCAKYLENKLKSYGFEVMVQTASIRTFDNKQFRLQNIIASFNPEKQKRILLSSHWDTRPWADSDTEDKDKPFDGANDGASGVGVALEVARQIKLTNPEVGVDIIYFDLEDYGQSGGNADTWCLGSQYWSKNLHKPGYYANFGVLLDMVGGKNALFPMELNSYELAPFAVEKVWKAADKLGYGNYFIAKTEGFVGVDDHIFVNNAGIPCIDIIEYNPSRGGFGYYHHTHDDNMDVINKNTLKAVGQTLLEVIYSE